jgi:mRNA-degrading endonuclease toxin of MazEF toxin-antitoxin module
VAKSRPGVIVSNDRLNSTASVVEVVYLTTQPKKDLPTHVCLESTGVQSTALCEQIDHVSVNLLGDRCGTCTAEELQAIDRALLVSLGIDSPKTAPATTAADPTRAKEIAEHDPVNHPSHYTSGKIEVIEFIEDKGLSFHLGNAVKYIARAGKKDPTKTAEDLQKAVWYLCREILRLAGLDGIRKVVQYMLSIIKRREGETNQ